MKNFLFLFLVLPTLHAVAQSDSNTVIIHKDPRIDALIKKQVEINELTTRDARRFVQGYRILVISTNNRNKVQDAKSKLYQEFPELKSYMMYQAPFFKLKAGNFTTRKEADEYLENIKRFFPTGIYVVRDTVEVDPDKSDELE